MVSGNPANVAGLRSIPPPDCSQRRRSDSLHRRLSLDFESGNSVKNRLNATTKLATLSDEMIYPTFQFTLLIRDGFNLQKEPGNLFLHKSPLLAELATEINHAPDPVFERRERCFDGCNIEFTLHHRLRPDLVPARLVRCPIRMRPFLYAGDTDYTD
ncbi:MAG: hypothetical protein EBZ36_02790 [Acidobacteria bacterium]|nr:hypothetical protein [Acidobacteriota bacterium]